MQSDFLDFETPIIEINKKLDELDKDSPNINKEKEQLEKSLEKIYSKIYSNLTPWQKVQVARHPERPHTLDYINSLFSDFIPLAGDRRFAEDEAVLAGFAKFEETSVLVIGQEKGEDLNSRIERNFGMMKPEGYRKCVRLMQLADRFKIPVITFVDTPGAYPGMGAEQRGQASAIANSIEVSMSLKVPNISIIICDHAARDILAVADSSIILSNGKVIAQGTPSELINDDKAKSHYFGDSFKFN